MSRVENTTTSSKLSVGICTLLFCPFFAVVSFSHFTSIIARSLFCIHVLNIKGETAAVVRRSTSFLRTRCVFCVVFKRAATAVDR